MIAMVLKYSFSSDYMTFCQSDPLPLVT